MSVEELHEKIQEFRSKTGKDVELEFHKCVTIKLVDRETGKLFAYTGMGCLETVAYCIDIYPTAWEVLSE